MTKAELVSIVAKEIGLSKTETAVVVDRLIEAIKEALMRGETVEIRRFGSFRLKKRKNRLARNPRTGEPVPIPDRFIPFFKPSNDFKKLIPQSGIGKK
ncbi:MAG: HU family DNA-binding protein [bacterium]